MTDDDFAPPAPKRTGPPEVEAVTLDGLRFEAVHWGRERGLGQNGGYIEAFDADSGRSLWLLQVYKITYQDDLEEDVQDVFIEELKAGAKGRLTVTDENGHRFLVDPATRSVSKR
jgi:hypothetical protein